MQHSSSLSKCQCFNFLSILILFAVIQETPKASEKLYILDSIDVPLSELNKYRHLSVVNKLPENIILPPPPPLRHESSAPIESNATEPTTKPSTVEPSPPSTTDSKQTQQVKNDFEETVAYDEADLVETKNISIIQHVKKIIKKYQKGKHREQMRTKTKGPTNNIHVTNEHSNDLSTPLRSLSPAHGFDGEMPSAVDLSVHSKEIIDEFEFIDNLSICSNDSESGYNLITSPLTEYLELTEPHSPVAGEGGAGSGSSEGGSDGSSEGGSEVETVKKDDTNEKVESKPNQNENCDKTNEPNEPKEVQPVVEEERKELDESKKEEEKEKEVENENEIEIEKETKSADENEKEAEVESSKAESESEVENEEKIEAKDDVQMETSTDDRPSSEISIETLRNICISAFNSEKFRSYFAESVLIPSTDAEDATTTESERCITEAEHGVADSTKNNEDPIESAVQPIEKLANESIGDKPEPLEPPCLLSQVPSLRILAINAVLMNQSSMSRNLKQFTRLIEADVERRMIDSLSADSGAYRVRTLQELAREVAVTIYSFNVKPLQDMCRLAIEKYNHLYLMNTVNRLETSDSNSTPECAVPIENKSNSHGIYSISNQNYLLFMSILF